MKAKFRQSFTQVIDDAWAKTENRFLVSFSENGILYNVFLDRKGKQTSQIRYYEEKDLPASVRDHIRTLDGCFTIGGVREITTNGATAFLLTLN